MAVDDPGFYRCFEDRYRGSREAILERLRQYKPYLEQVNAWHEKPVRGLDLGCGRGEWLEVLAESGLSARGVDLDEGMLAACQEQGLEASNEDAIVALRACADASLAVVSGFHIAEHLPFYTLRELIEQAYRTLAPGGLLVLETPNPENLKVAAIDFYMDPTHRHPLPPQLLAFAVEFSGFEHCYVLRLQEPAAAHDTAFPSLIEIHSCASPDYAVLAVKQCPESLAPEMSRIAARHGGVTAHALMDRHDEGQRRRSERVDQRIDRNEEELSGLVQQTGDLSSQMENHDRERQRRDEWVDQRIDRNEEELSGLVQRTGDLSSQMEDHDREQKRRDEWVDQRIDRNEEELSGLIQRTDRNEEELSALIQRTGDLSSQMEDHDREQQRRDEWVDRRIDRNEQELSGMAQRLDGVSDQGADQAADIKALHEKMEELNHQMTALYDSRSWRMTAPLRMVVGSSRELYSILRPLPRRMARSALRVDRLWAFLHRHHRIHRFLRQAVRVAGLDERIRRVIHGASRPTVSQPDGDDACDAPVSDGVKGLPCDTQHVARRLKAKGE